MRNDFRPVIEPAANTDVQFFAAFVPAGVRRKPLGLVRRGRKGKTGWSPRALANPMRARGIQRSENGGDRRAGKIPTALSKGEVAAKSRLQILDRSAEVYDVAVNQRRQHLDEDQAAQPISIACWHWRQRGKGCCFVGSVHAVVSRIKDQQDAPIVGKWQMADDRSYQGFAAMAAVNHKAATSKKPDPDSGPRTAPQRQGVTIDRQRQIVQSAHPGGNG